MQSRINIAIVDNRLGDAVERASAIEGRTDWPYLVETQIFTNTDDLIDSVEGGSNFFDVIITDVYMPKRGDDPSNEGSPQEGAISIAEWLGRKRQADEDFKHVQLRWVSRYSDVSSFLHRYVNNSTYSWLHYITHHDKRSFLTVDLLLMVDTAIRMAVPVGTHSDGPDHLVFLSRAMTEVVQLAKHAAATDGGVIISGESGTGKEEIAKFIHNSSARSGRNLISVNCAVSNEQLLESDLFGHEKGAFTGAATKRVGLFEAANNSTLFLDEIGEMPPSMQAKLLRVLETKTYHPLGRSLNLSPNKTDFRLVSATNRNLREEVSAGRFREDLFYRLNVFEINIPPLRGRPEDIEPLASFFLQDFAQRASKGLLKLSGESLSLLRKYEWPGNIRELRNVIQRAVALAGINGEIHPALLPDFLQKGTPVKLNYDRLTPQEQSYYKVLKHNSFNISKAAASLGKTRQAVHKFIHGTNNNSGELLHPALKRLYDEGKALADADEYPGKQAERIAPLRHTGVLLEEDF